MASQLRIALIQAPLAWQSPSKNRTYFTRKIQSVNKDADLIILPEMFTTGFTMTPEQINEDEGDETLQWMLQISKKQHTAVVGSLPFYENNKYTNRLFFVSPDQNVFHYDKRHTFTLAGENKVYEAGQKKLIVDYKG